MSEGCTFSEWFVTFLEEARPPKPTPKTQAPTAPVNDDQAPGDDAQDDQQP